MVRNISRREVLQLGAAVGAGAIGLGTQVESVTAASDRYIVDTSTAADDSWKQGVEVVHEFPEINFAAVEGSSTALSSVRHQPDLEITYDLPEEASPDALSGDNGDARSAYQWDKQAQNAFDVHDAGYTGEGAKIAIIDTGIAGDHSDLAPNFNAEESISTAGGGIDGEPEYYDIDSHGTHCAGIAAAADNGGGIVGVAPDAEIVGIRVFGGEFAYGSDIIAGQMHAVEVGCDVGNLSLGGYPYPQGLDTQLSKEMDERAATYGLENGCLFVAAAGNDDSNLDNDGDVLSLPNQADGYMSVSATGPSGFNPGMDLEDVPLPTHAPSFFTNYGENAIDVSAAGGNVTYPLRPGYANDLVYSTVPEDTWSWKAGTSMAAPQVAGLVALVKAENPDATPERIQYHIKRTADQINDVEYQAAEYIQPDAEWDFGNGVLEDAYSSPLYRGSGHIDVEQAAMEPVPFPQPLSVDGHTIAPRDPDGDGQFEDINGDGTVDMEDVNALFALLMSGPSLTATEEQALDFNGDGSFDQFDVQALLDIVR